MTNKEFVSAAKNISVLNTAYGKGTFGNKYTASFIKSKSAQYPDFYTQTVLSRLEKKSKEGTLYLFDCCGLIKGIIWNFPNVKYNTGGMSDVNDQGIWDKYCADKNTNMSDILPGEIMHMKGHVGIYIGDGKVIEATNKWTKNVLVSSLDPNDKYYRKWEAHGKLTLLKYEGIASAPTQTQTIHIVQRGENLTYIAKKYKTTIQRICAANPSIKNPNLIYVGQKLIIK